LEKIYLVIWEDRHTDTTAHPFTDLDNAIVNARQAAMSVCRWPDEVEEWRHGDINAPNWFIYSSFLFHLKYSCEGDHVRVVEADIDKPMY